MRYLLLQSISGCSYLNNFNKLKFHISGSIGESVSSEIIKITHKFIKKLVIEILKRNGRLIITFGAEPKKHELSLIFDYTIIEGIEEFYLNNSNEEKSLVSTFLYHSYRKKIPAVRERLVSNFLKYEFVRIKELPQLSSFGGKLRSELAKITDVIIILGGTLGVNDLVENCHQENKIILPLNIDLGRPGALKCIDMINNGSLILYPSNIREYAISEINKFCLKTESNIEELIEKVLHLTLMLIEEKGEEIIKLIMKDIKSLQEKNRAIKPDENKYSIILVEFLRRSLKSLGYFPHAQEPSGKTKIGYDDRAIQGGMGELDIRIVDKNNELMHICETLILTYLNTSVISEHLNKIFDYDCNGLPVNIIVVYSKADDFYSLWIKYLDFLSKFNWNYPLVDTNIEDISEKRDFPAEIKLALTRHHREGVICKIYHFFVNLN